MRRPTCGLDARNTAEAASSQDAAEPRAPTTEAMVVPVRTAGVDSDMADALPPGRCIWLPAQVVSAHFDAVDGQEQQAAALVVAAQQPVGDGEDFAAGGAAHRGEQH